MDTLAYRYLQMEQFYPCKFSGDEFGCGRRGIALLCLYKVWNLYSRS
jgi:hypothetical protein